MFGAYRLILACLVALSHFGLVVDGFNPGQWAVLSFYVLSGFLMEHQFHKLGTSRLFYLDRFLRIYPLFFAVVLFATFLLRPSLRDFTSNALLLPLDYYTFTNVPILVGPAWSLACEVHFYLLVPWLARASTQTLRWIVLGSIGIFCVSPALPVFIFWAYAGLPGILFAFLTGMLIKRRDTFFLRGIWLLFAGLLVVFAWTKFSHSGMLTGIHINVCVGYLTAVPLVCWLSSLPSQVRWDQRIGLLSYPLFLIHDPLKILVNSRYQHVPMLALLALAVAAAAILVVLVEKPFDLIRYRIRRPPAKAANPPA